MSFSQLSANELAEIDALCIAFEGRVRDGEDVDIDAFLADYHGPQKSAVYEELLQVRDELESKPGGAFGTGEFNAVSSGSSRSSAPLLTPGESLGPYCVEELIGLGGMGQVFRGTDERLQRSVAIKVLSDDWASQPDRIERFNREARMVAALKHSNIVQIYDVGSHAGRPYAVMEHLEGETLRDRMSREPMSPVEIRQMGMEAAEALAAAHEKGIIHRDLKPENLFLLKDGTLKLLDFGLSRIDSDQPSGSDPTATGVIMGTLGYLSPEQARGDQVTPQADIFSLGCVLYEAFYNERAFRGHTPSEAIASILNDTPALRDPTAEKADPRLAGIIHRCLAKSLDQRVSSAKKLAISLRGARSTEGRDCDEQSDESYSFADDGGRGLDRRSLFRFVGGAAIGAGGLAVYQVMKPMMPSEMVGIDSIAVLPMTVEYSVGTAPPPSKMLAPGEELAAVLSNKLVDLTDLEVRPFHAVKLALAKGSAAGIAKELNVDAIVTGRVVKSDTQQEIVLTVQPTDPNLAPITDVFRTGIDTSLIEVSQRAETLARIIGRQLAARDPRTADAVGYRCFVDGSARLDPNDPEGLQHSLMCFDDAIYRDENFSEAYGARALARVLLMQQGQFQPGDLMKIREDSGKAINLKSTSSYGNLAKAVVAWQLDLDHESAASSFRIALAAMPKDWLIHYQYAFFLMADGRRDDAVRAVDQARRLDPTSVSLRLCARKLSWFAGDVMNAMSSVLATLINDPKNLQAKGLFIDMLEQSKRCDLAGRVLNGQMLTTSDLEVDLDGACTEEQLARYRALRLQSLRPMPYGFYGDEINQLIFDVRRGVAINDVDLRQRFEGKVSPWLSLALSSHPALESLSRLPFAMQSQGKAR